jgi:hypothetical protein
MTEMQTKQKARELKISEAMGILSGLDFPKQQINERSALVLLSVLDLKPEQPWSEATNPLIGITPMMMFFQSYYKKKYQPNTRETVRRQTVHQFVQAALIVLNPDEPQRPINSPKTVYQIDPSALKMLRSFGTSKWKKQITLYCKQRPSLRDKYAAERTKKFLTVLNKATNNKFYLSPGGQNILVKKVVEEFCPQFAPEGRLLYVGDAGEKWAIREEKVLKGLGVQIDEHGKMPDAVILLAKKRWLILVEAVTSHGPMDSKRHFELKKLFSGCKCGLIFITAFLDRPTMKKFAADIAWETEVWIADSPTHLIHFDGERFLGPYQTEKTN